MIDQLSAVIPHGPELYWELGVALVFALACALIAPILLDSFKTVQRVPRRLVVRLKTLDMANPLVVFVVVVVGVLVALTIYNLLGAL